MMPSPPAPSASTPEPAPRPASAGHRDAEALLRPAPLPAGVGRLLVIAGLVIGAGLGGFAAWAAAVPLDRAIAGGGSLVVTSLRQTVQPLIAGRIRTIAVAEGDRVRQGETLVMLDTTRAEAELASLRRQRVLARASVERLRAEMRGDATLVWSADLIALAQRAGAGDLLAVQHRAFGSRDGHARSGREQAEARERQGSAELAGQRAMLAQITEQRRLLETEVATLEDLARSGHYPRIRVMEQARELATVRASEARSRADVVRLEQVRQESRAASLRLASGLARDVQGELVEAEGRDAELLAREAALGDTIAQSRLRAPVDGVVTGLAVHTVDGVVQPGQALMSIVPDHEPFLVEARMPLAATEQLAAGQTVRLRFVTMEHAATPVVDGLVQTVSADRLDDPRTGEGYLLLRAAVPDDQVSRLAAAGVSLRAGLPVEVMVKVGRRTLASYLLKPLADGFAKALIE